MSLIKIVIMLLLVVFQTAYAGEHTTSIMVLSVSSDGKYVISSDLKKRIILWDIPDKTFKVISTNGNIYSAYFIKNTNDFMWQDLNDFVHVQNVDGNELLSFHNFPVYGEVITSDLKHYFASDIDWALYSGYGKPQKVIKPACPSGGNFIGIEKLLNLTLSDDNQFLLTSGVNGFHESTKNGIRISDIRSAHTSLIDGLMLWSVKTGNPIFRFPGNVAKTFATISPDNKYVIGVDEGTMAFVWDLRSGKRLFDLWDLFMGGNIISKTIVTTVPKGFEHGAIIENGITKASLMADMVNHKPVTFMIWYDTKGLISPPVAFFNRQNLESYSIFSVKFIDNNHYLRFDTYMPWAILYNVLDPRPVKYIPLGESPEPSLDDYSRDQAIDTAPAAHILVVAKRNSSGLIVYQYDPNTQTLNKIWTPDADGWF